MVLPKILVLTIANVDLAGVALRALVHQPLPRGLDRQGNQHSALRRARGLQSGWRRLRELLGC